MSRSLRSLSLSIVLFAAAFIVPASAQTAKETVLANTALNTDATVIQASDGNLYGTGNSDYSQGGAFFAVSLSGNITFPYSFQGGSDGGIPEAPPVEGPDGNFYGVAGYGGTYGQGVIYKISGTTETVVYNFTGGADGAQPESSLVFDSAGNLYGVAPAYGTYNNGAIFKFNIASGTLTPLYQFCAVNGCPDGSQPRSGLVMGSDGYLYGTVGYGGAYGGGTFFKVSTGGSFSVVYSFCTTNYTNCPEGYYPKGALVEGPDGNFYGTNQVGGSATYGTVYKITPGGSITPLYTFTNGTDGSSPQGLVMASDGNLYVATQSGGDATCACGSVVKVTPSGGYTLLYDFTNNNGDSNPYAGTMQASDGDIYGTTSGYLQGGSGTVYKIALTPALAPPVQLALSNSSVSPGTQITLSWKALNTFSDSLQQCYAYIQGNPAGAGTWTGKQAGTYSASTKLYTGSAKITPTANGTYTYALTCGGVESGFATLTVASNKTDTTTALTASLNPVTVGQSVKLTATVTKASGSATPTGSVAFSVGSDTLTTVNLNSSAVASFTASTNGLAPGSYPVVASYSGDTNFNSSDSAADTVKLEPAPTATTLTATPTTVTPPASVTLTATVKRSTSGATGIPTGSVTFYANGNDALVTIKLNSSGVATINASSKGYPAGKYPITAKYLGDGGDAVSTSTAVTVTVK